MITLVARPPISAWSYKENMFNNLEMDMPRDSQDILSAFYYVRNQDLEVGGERICEYHC